MIRYFQLTPEILLEYIYEDDPKLNEDNIRGNEKDISKDETSTLLLKSNMFGSKYLCFKNEFEGLDSFSNLVLPLNDSETQFVVAKSAYQNFFSKINSSNIYALKNNRGYIYEDTNYDIDIIKSGESCDVKYDKCILHFTSKNYFGSYDSLIFQTYVYMKNKAKLYLSSFLFKKTSNLKLKEEHMLYHEKLYTTHIEFDIPSIFAIFGKYNEEFNFALEAQGVELLKNTPIGINIYGVSGSIKGIDNYERLKTFKLNTISIPYIYNKLDEIYVNIYEAMDADFYYIEPKINSTYRTFVNYIESIGEDIRSYIIMHDLQLREVWMDENHVTHSEITHRENHIININDDDEDDDISMRFEEKIKFRPICMYNGFATIIDTIKIINTVDSSSYEVTGSIDIVNPHKYGKKLNRLNIKNENRPIINVYNKRNANKKGTGGSGYGGSGYGDFGISGSGSGSSGSGTGGSGSGSGTGGSGSGSGTGSGGSGSGSSISGGSGYGGYVTGSSGYGGYGYEEDELNPTITFNKGGGFNIENNSQNITSFIECTNIGVSIVELSPEDIY